MVGGCRGYVVGGCRGNVVGEIKAKLSPAGAGTWAELGKNTQYFNNEKQTNKIDVQNRFKRS